MEDQVAPNNGMDDQGNDFPYEQASGEAYGAGISVGNMHDYVASMSLFERLVINCMDTRPMIKKIIMVFVLQRSRI